MAWNDLTLSDKARMIELAVKSGITNLRDIQDVYNTYASGGQKEDKNTKYKKPKEASILKDIAYRIGVSDDVSEKGAATPATIVKALLDKNPKLDDNKYAYIYGTSDRYPEVEEEVKGFDYTPYINRYGYKGVKNVHGVINPNNAYEVEPEYKNLLTELAKNKYHFYDNADDMFLDSDPENLGYRDDVANFIHQLDVDDKGNVVVHDSDIYDFNPVDYHYAGELPGWAVRAEAKAMNRIGTPYIIRQENQPVYFNGLRRGSQGIQHALDAMSEEEIAKATNSILLNPVYVEAKHPDPEYNPYDFADGGPLWDPNKILISESPKEEAKESKYSRIPRDRYNSAYSTLREVGYPGVDADRLARILAAQSISETGWVDADSLHNYAGYLDAKGKKIKYDSPESFWRAHINNLSNRWPNWDKAENIREYFDIINNTALGLDTKDKFNAYNKQHRDNPVYIYAPDWENVNYLNKMLSINKRASKAYPSKLGPIYD